MHCCFLGCLNYSLRSCAAATHVLRPTPPPKPMPEAGFANGYGRSTAADLVGKKTLGLRKVIFAWARRYVQLKLA